MGWKKSSGSRQGAVVDPSSVSQNSGRQIDWDKVTDAYRVTAQTITVAAAAAAAATTVTVAALPVALSVGTVLSFDSGEFAKLTVAAPAGATELTVEALVNALEGGETAIYAGTGPKRIKAGTVMVELASKLVVPRAIRPGAEESSMLLVTDAVEGELSHALNGYGCYIGGAFYENLLPDASGDPATLPADYKTELAANSLGFAFETYTNSMLS